MAQGSARVDSLACIRPLAGLTHEQLDGALDWMETMAIVQDTKWRVGPVRFGADSG